MSKVATQNLGNITRKINKNIIISFVITLVFFAVIIGFVFINYTNNEKKFISQKLNTTFSTFIAKESQKLISITMLVGFRDYLHSGWISRRNRYNAFLAQMLSSNLDTISGMIIYNSHEENIFSYGEATKDSVLLDLCYLNRRLLNFDVGTCSYKWKIYFKQDVITKKLKELNPELVDCTNCSKPIIEGNSFGDFPMIQFTNMQVSLNIADRPLTILWKMIVFIVISILALVLWNVARIKSIFKEYLFRPIVEITSRIKENKKLPRVDMDELAYLVEQIEQWKKQIIELEEVRAKEKTKIEEEKFKMMQSIGASIAHELRTPLRSIISGVSGIEKYLPTLLDAYDLAKRSGLAVQVIKPQQLELLNKVLSNLKIEGGSANTIIDIFLMKIKESIVVAEIKDLSIAECLDEALHRYGFQEVERKLINCDITKDFKFKGDRLLVVHILFNLFKNALYYIASARKGQIYIYFSNEQDGNKLHFKDTGKGIEKEMLPYVFNRFYSKTEGGVGIGLYFCKMAMEWMKGSITCESEAGEYTEFTLYFPKLN